MPACEVFKTSVLQLTPRYVVPRAHQLKNTLGPKVWNPNERTVLSG